MKEVQVTCPQCGRNDAYFEYEKGDFTNVFGVFVQNKWKCSHCGYPEIKWILNGAIYQPQKLIINIRITDQDGNVIKEWNE